MTKHFDYNGEQITFEHKPIAEDVIEGGDWHIEEEDNIIHQIYPSIDNRVDHNPTPFNQDFVSNNEIEAEHDKHSWNQYISKYQDITSTDEQEAEDKSIDISIKLPD